MKTIGLIGGVTWQSTAEYYRIINTEVSRALGGVSSARVAMISLNFADLISFRSSGDEDSHRAMYCDAARSLEQAGADFILICSNTGHLRFDDVARTVAVPVLHIADAAGRAVRAQGISRIGLLGTATTMGGAFMATAFRRMGLSVCTPDPQACARIDELILGEMARGIFSAAARNYITQTIAELAERHHAAGILLACTELPLLLSGRTFGVPVFDTLALHAKAAVEYALSRPSPARFPTR